jgi:hypothetical protein
MSTFIGDSTYTRAPPTHRSPLRSNNMFDKVFSRLCKRAGQTRGHEKSLLPPGKVRTIQ